MVTEIVELLEIRVAGGGVGLREGILAKKIAGFVEAEADVAESTFAVEVVLADGGAGAFELVEGVDRIKSQDGHEDEESTEAGNHGGARADAASGARGGSREWWGGRMGGEIHTPV
jgi:hypothetical protein